MYDTSAPTCGGSVRLVQVGADPGRGPHSLLERDAIGFLRSLLLAVWADPGWLGRWFAEDVAALLATPAGPALLTAVAALPQGRCGASHPAGDGIDIPGIPGHGSPGNPCVCGLAVAAAWQACQSYAAAGARAAVVGAAGPEPVVLPRGGARPELADPAREELSQALRLSPESAATRIRQSRSLAAQPELLQLVADGVIPDASAVRAVDALANLDAADARDCAAELADRVRRRIADGRRPWTGTDAVAGARRLAVAKQSYREARRRAVAGRRVRRWDNGDGTATIEAVVPDVAAERMYRRLTSLAAGLGAADPRPTDARRADLLVDLVLGSATPSHSGVEVQVVISAGDLLGMADGCAQLTGVGPIPAELARELAADATWRAWVRDAAGSIAATGSAGYRPSAAVARQVRAREAHCRMPGCRRPALRCDLDHAVPYPKGSTTAANLGPLCRRHHLLKTHAGWRLAADDPLEHTWRTPAGVQVADTPEPPWPE